MATLVHRFAQELERNTGLPSRAMVLTRLVVALGNDDVDLTDLSDIIKQDPAMSGGILKVANSAAAAGKREVLSISEALLRVGLAQTGRLALAMSLYNMIPHRGLGGHLGDFWMHSLGTATAASVVVRRALPDASGTDEESAYLVGLFHDIGLIALAGHFPADYERVAEAARQAERPFFAMEREVLGTDHGELGALMADRWKLPKIAASLIRSHHGLDGVDTPFPLVQYVLRVAEQVCRQAQLGDLAEGWQEAMDTEAMTALGLAPETVSDIIWEVRGETEKAESLLALAR